MWDHCVYSLAETNQLPQTQLRSGFAALAHAIVGGDVVGDGFSCSVPTPAATKHKACMRTDQIHTRVAFVKCMCPQQSFWDCLDFLRVSTGLKSIRDGFAIEQRLKSENCLIRIDGDAVDGIIGLGTQTAFFDSAPDFWGCDYALFVTRGSVCGMIGSMMLLMVKPFFFDIARVGFSSRRVTCIYPD